MKKLTKKIISIVSVICILCTLLNIPVYALEEYNLPLTNETQFQINKLLQECPQYEDYLNGILSDIKSSTVTDSEKLNEHIIDAIEKLYDFKQQGDMEYKAVLENHEKLVAEHKAKSKSARTEIYDSLLSNYSIGTAIVEAAGCPIQLGI